MKIEFTGRNTRVTAAVKAHVEEKLEHAVRVLDDVIGAHVILTTEKYRHIAEIVIQRRNGTLTGRAQSEDMFKSIDTAVDRIEVQVRRKREKVVSRKRRGTGAKFAAVLTAQAEDEAGLIEDELEMDTVALRVVDETPDRIKPIGVEEAVLLLDKASRPFVVFRNSATGRVATLYRRANGEYGLVGFKS